MSAHELLIELARHHPERIPRALRLEAGRARKRAVDADAEKIAAAERARQEGLEADARALQRALASPGRLRQIARLTCLKYGIPEKSFYEQRPRRFPPLIRARFVAYYLARELTTASFPLIGKIYGGKDHTTILHGCRRIERALPGDAGLRAEVAELLQVFSVARPQVGAAA